MPPIPTIPPRRGRRDSAAPPHPRADLEAGPIAHGNKCIPLDSLADSH